LYKPSRYVYRNYKNKRVSVNITSLLYNIIIIYNKGKVIPLQAWCGPDGG